jgi:hypothetical protein
VNGPLAFLGTQAAYDGAYSPDDDPPERRRRVQPSPVDREPSPRPRPQLDALTRHAASLRSARLFDVKVRLRSLGCRLP